MFNFDFFKRKNGITGNITDDALVLSSTRKGSAPYVTRIDRARLSAATLEARATEAGHALVLCNPDGSFDTVAVFAQADAAAEAVAAATEAFRAKPARRCGWLHRLLHLVLWLLALVGLVTIFVLLTPRGKTPEPQTAQQTVAPAPVTQAPPASRAVTPGEPVPADRLFGN